MPEHCKNFRAALDGVRGQLEAFNPDDFSGDELGTLRRHNPRISMRWLARVLPSKMLQQSPNGRVWDFMEEGCTDMTHLSCGNQRYMVFLDMHSWSGTDDSDHSGYPDWLQIMASTRRSVAVGGENYQFGLWFSILQAALKLAKSVVSSSTLLFYPTRSVNWRW